MVWQVLHCLPAWRSVAGRGGQGDNVTKEAAARAVEALAKVGRHGPWRRWPKWEMAQWKGDHGDEQS